MSEGTRSDYKGVTKVPRVLICRWTKAFYISQTSQSFTYQTSAGCNLLDN